MKLLDTVTQVNLLLVSYDAKGSVKIMESGFLLLLMFIKISSKIQILITPSDEMDAKSVREIERLATAGSKERIKEISLILSQVRYKLNARIIIIK